MDTEYEAKFVNVDHDEFRKVLKETGATLITPMRLMRRAIFDNSELKSKSGYVRLRDEGDKVTLIYKQFDDLSIDGAKERAVVVSNFDTTLEIIESLGTEHSSLQESKRETWDLNGAEIVLDEWPWLNPYIEIEAENEEKVRNVSEALGLNWADAHFGDVMVAYRAQYPYLTENQTVADLKRVKFNDPLPDMLKSSK